MCEFIEHFVYNCLALSSRRPTGGKYGCSTDLKGNSTLH